jgi:hypothetical protein
MDSVLDKYKALEKETGLETPVQYTEVTNSLQELKNKLADNRARQELIPYIDQQIELYKNPTNLSNLIETKKSLNQNLEQFYKK